MLCLCSWSCPCCCSCSCCCACSSACSCSSSSSCSALPLAFLLASASSFARRKRQNGPPEEPKSTPEGGQMASWRPLGASWAPGRPQVAAKAAPEPPLDGSWSALGGSWSRLGALLAPLGAVWGSPGDPRRVHGRSFWEVFLEICPGRLKNQRCLMFFFALFGAFV